MTTRDPRYPRLPSGPSRDPTASLSLPPENGVAYDDDDDPDSHPSIALGSHINDERTRVESPNAKVRTPQPMDPSRPPPVPRRVATDGSDERLGQVLGSYRVIELLGKGGMGFVYRAEHTKLGREVAIKLLRSDYARRRDAVARFIQEARTVNRIRHRNIVDIPDIVELDDGTTFIVMEMLRGNSLGKWARSGVDLPRALAVLVQICDALASAHAVDVVHRDLKPDNIIVVPTADGAELVKLLDFGVAKLLNRDDEDIGFQTAAGSVIGTPAYMSPEQAGGMAVDARSDIYSLGAIMYELFTGQPMFRGRSFGEYVRKHLTERPVPPRETQAGAMIDPRLDALIMKALEKDPDQRFGQIVELRDALLGMLGSLETHPPFAMTSGLSAVRVLPTIAPTGPSQVMHPSQFYSGYSQIALAPPPQPRTSIWTWVIGATVAIGLGVGGALWFATGGDAPAQPAPVAVAKPAIESTPIPTPPPARYLPLRFDSLPAGAVYEDGHATLLCHTPCTYNVDLQDGGATDRRAFVIRAEGYRDGTVTVDLAGEQRDYGVTLARVVAAAPVPPTVVPTPPLKAVPTTKKRPGKKDPAGVEEVAPTAPTPPPPPVNEKKEPPKKKKTTVDSSETLDPFAK